MNRSWKHWLGGWIPPHLRRVLDAARADGAVRYSGNYAAWEEARSHSSGYDAPVIVDKVKQALEKVERGEAAYERDSVLFDHVEYSYPLLAGLLRTALANSGRLCVVDIGGSLGSTYFQCRDLLGNAAVRWNVVEQPAFAACGRDRFQNETLRFFDDLQVCLASGPADVAVLSGVLPYVESPHALLNAIVDARIPRVIIDRTPVWREVADRLTVQSVPRPIYGFPASYPAWILNREGLLNHFVPGYRLVFEFDALAGVIDVDGIQARDAGFFFEQPSTSAMSSLFFP